MHESDYIQTPFLWRSTFGPGAGCDAVCSGFSCERTAQVLLPSAEAGAGIMQMQSGRMAVLCAAPASASVFVLMCVLHPSREIIMQPNTNTHQNMLINNQLRAHTHTNSIFNVFGNPKHNTIN